MQTASSLLRPALLVLLPALISPVLLADPAEDRVAEIRARYQTIEGAKLRRSAIRFESPMEAASATWTGFYEDGELVKVHLASALGDHGATDDYFYYEGGRLFFAYSVAGSWQFTGRTLPNGESETVDKTVEHRLYLSADRIVRHLVKEASAKDLSKLPLLLAKAENRPAEDPERAKEIVERGLGAFDVRAAGDLGRIIGVE